MIIQARWLRIAIILSFSKQRDTKIIIKQTIGSSISMKFAYQTQTKQYNDQSHLVCVKHGFVVKKPHARQLRTLQKKSI